MKPVFYNLGLAVALVVAIIFSTNAEVAFSQEAIASHAQDIQSEVSRERLPEDWSDGDVFGLRSFAEPLVAEPRVSSEQERGAFSKAINAYLLGGRLESLEGFPAPVASKPMGLSART